MPQKIRHVSKRDNAALMEFADDIKKLLGGNLLSVVLFGSKITGRATKESDIDVLVMVAHISPETKDEVINAAFDVNLKYNVYISPRVIPREIFEHPVWKITPFLKSIQSQGVAII